MSNQALLSLGHNSSLQALGRPVPVAAAVGMGCLIACRVSPPLSQFAARITRHCAVSERTLQLIILIFMCSCKHGSQGALQTRVHKASSFVVHFVDFGRSEL